MGAIGTAVTIPGSVTINWTVGCSVGVAITGCGVSCEVMGVTNGVSTIGASAVIKVGVTSNVGACATSPCVGVGG